MLASEVKTDQALSPALVNDYDDRMAESDDFTLDDFARHIARVLRMQQESDEKAAALAFALGGERWEDSVERIQRIIGVMTPAEKAAPEVIDLDQQLRIAMLSGTKPAEVAEFLREFDRLRTMLRQARR